jgi:xanthine dehydrogenase accessory factor
MSRVVNTICNLLKQGEAMVLATILSHEGSTPRTAGTKMIVRSDGDTISTVGGGLVEAEVIKAASEVFRTRTAKIMPFDLTGTDVSSMDLVCGGRLEILVEFLEPNPVTLEVFRGLAAALKAGDMCHLVADLGSVNERTAVVKRCVLRGAGSTLGDLVCPSELTNMLVFQSGKARYPVILTIRGRDYLVEPSFVPGTVYLFGAGHVSQQVAPLAKLVDFRIAVLDDRTEFANSSRFPNADEVRVIQSFEGVFSDLPVDGDSYLAILTRGHLHDKTVLKQALRTEARYIGMIGSRPQTGQDFP